MRVATRDQGKRNVSGRATVGDAIQRAIQRAIQGGIYGAIRNAPAQVGGTVPPTWAVRLRPPGRDRYVFPVHSTFSGIRRRMDRATFGCEPTGYKHVPSGFWAPAARRSRWSAPCERSFPGNLNRATIARPRRVPRRNMSAPPHTLPHMDTHLALDGFEITCDTTDAEIDAQVLAVCRHRAAEMDATIAAEGEELRTKWRFELLEMRDNCAPGEAEEHPEHFLSRLVPHADGCSLWWAPFEVSADTSNAAIEVVVDGGIDRWGADERSERRHQLTDCADAWTAELQRLRDERRQ